MVGREGTFAGTRSPDRFDACLVEVVLLVITVGWVLLRGLSGFGGKWLLTLVG
jgi:hypothetical protein